MSEQPEQVTPRRKRRYVIAALLLALFCAGLIRVSTGYRALPFLRERVISEVNDALSPSSVSIGELRFRFDPVHLRLKVRGHDIIVADANKKPLITLPRSKAALPLIDLIRGDTRLHSLELRSPSLTVTEKPGGGFALFIDDAPGPMPQTPVESMDFNRLLAGIERIGIKILTLTDARLHIRSADPFEITLPESEIRLSGDKEHRSFSYRVRLNKSKQPALIEGTADSKPATTAFETQATFAGLPVAIATPFLARFEALAPLKGLEASVSGAFSLSTRDGAADTAHIEAHMTGGQFDNPDFLPGVIPIGEFKFRIDAEQGLSVIRISGLSFSNPEIDLIASGEFTHGTEGLKGTLRAAGSNFAVLNIGRYWPLSLSPDARGWVVENLQDGLISSAEAELMVAPDATTLKATLEVEHAQVRIMPHLPLAEEAKGIVELTEDAMKVHIESAQAMSGSVLEKGTLEIPSFTSKGVLMHSDITVRAPAKDVARIMAKEHLAIADELKLNPDTIQGEAHGSLKLTVPLYSSELPEAERGEIYDLEAKVSNVAQDKALGKWNIKSLNGKIKVTNKEAALKAKTELNGIASALDITTQLSGGETLYHFIATIPSAKMDHFGFSLPEEISGPVGVDAHVKENSKGEAIAATLNLTDAVIDVPGIAYRKPAGKKALLEIQTKPDAEVLDAASFSFSAPSLKAKGRFRQRKKDAELLSLNLSDLRYRNNAFALDYQLNRNIRDISIKGKTLDLSAFRENEKANAKPDKTSPLKQLARSNITLALDVLVFDKGRELLGLSGHIRCPGETCTDTDIRALTGDGKPFTFRLSGKGGERHVSAQSPDAGGVLRALGVTANMRGGKLDYQADYTGATTQSGKLLITDYTIVNGPILARMLSLASLSGILNTMTGKGITFKKLSAKTTFDGDTVTIKDGKTYGSAIGITAEGTIAPFSETINLGGTLVPAYTANSILGNIPLFGKMLVGDEGGGIFAARFSIKGDTDAPDISVNPLSLLTPGFLRNLFDIFE